MDSGAQGRCQSARFRRTNLPATLPWLHVSRSCDGSGIGDVIPTFCDAGGNPIEREFPYLAALVSQGGYRSSPNGKGGGGVSCEVVARA